MNFFSEIRNAMNYPSARTHVLFSFSQPEEGQEQAFLDWYQGNYLEGLRTAPEVLSAKHYKQHPLDITRGRYTRPPFHFLGIYELSLDGAEQAEDVISLVAREHDMESSARPAATWLYYPCSEKVGRPTRSNPSMLTLAFANGLPGHDSEFKEWYATRHIRHALQIPALVSGQCFERTHYQRPGALPSQYSIIAVYEQEDEPESLIQSLYGLPEGALDFPTLDRSRFTESVYAALT